jgi:hypothetical protein
MQKNCFTLTLHNLFTGCNSVFGAVTDLKWSIIMCCAQIMTQMMKKKYQFSHNRKWQEKAVRMEEQQEAQRQRIKSCPT